MQFGLWCMPKVVLRQATKHLHATTTVCIPWSEAPVPTPEANTSDTKTTSLLALPPCSSQRIHRQGCCWPVIHATKQHDVPRTCEGVHGIDPPRSCRWHVSPPCRPASRRHLPRCNTRGTRQWFRLRLSKLSHWCGRKHAVHLNAQESGMVKHGRRRARNRVQYQRTSRGVPCSKSGPSAQPSNAVVHISPAVLAGTPHAPRSIPQVQA